MFFFHQVSSSLLVMVCIEINKNSSLGALVDNSGVNVNIVKTKISVVQYYGHLYFRPLFLRTEADPYVQLILLITMTDSFYIAGRGFNLLRSAFSWDLYIPNFKILGSNLVDDNDR